MFKNRKVWGIAIASMLVVGVAASAMTVFAAGADGQSVSQVVNSKLQIVAQKLGINTAGMTDEQVKAAISENGAQDADFQKVQIEPSIDDLKATAADWGIDTTGMTEDQISQALADYKTSNQQDGYSQADKDAISQKLGIDVSGMTDGQINAALKENKPGLADDFQNADREPSIDELKAVAVQWGINISGMTDGQIRHPQHIQIRKQLKEAHEFLK